MDKRLRVAIKQARKRGWTVEKARRSAHLHLCKEGCGMIVISATTSDHRALENILSDMRRKGAI